MRRSALAPALLATALLAAGCGGGGDDKASDTADTSASLPGATVDMNFTLFKQTELAIKTGEALTFKNNNPIKHVIVQGTYEVDSSGARTSEKDDGTFNLVVEKKGDVVTHTYDKAGTFRFFCTIHKNMNGEVTVS